VPALARYLAYVAAQVPPKKILVRIGGKTMLDSRNEADRARMVHRVRLNAADLPPFEALPVEAESEGGTLTLAVRATGIQRMETVAATGKEVRLIRSYESLDGKPITDKVRSGDVIAVRLRIQLESRQDYLLVEDRRPGGAEFAGETVDTKVKGVFSNSEFRDDRVCIFFRSLEAGTHDIVYYLRAETPGAYGVFPGCTYPMYAETLRGESAANHLEIVARSQPNVR
jgi:uncharacterized protein YfaS (alpha-2-macroglobulin family)